MNLTEEANLAGCCGLYCGLCTKYQSRAPSRCIGCLGKQRSWCSIYRCCVMKRGFVICIECDEYPCERYARRGWGGDWQSRTAQENLETTREVGLETWLRGQRERRLLLENLLDNYNDGRSMSFYCMAAAVMPMELVGKAVDEMLASTQGDDLDMTAKAKALRAIIEDLALKSGIDLKLRSKPRER